MVYLSDQRALAHFDRLLWGFQPTAFVPHALATAPDAHHAPIILCHHYEQLEHAQRLLTQPWLLNLDEQAISFHPQSQRIIEIVSHQETCKRLGRQRWRAYQSQGYELQAQELSIPQSV